MTHPERLKAAGDDLAAVVAGWDHARRSLVNAMHGQPGSGLGGSGGGRGSSSPVETALGLGPNGPGMRRDPAARKLAAMDQLAATIVKSAYLLRLLVDDEAPRPATARQRAEVERANSADPLCQHCTEHRRPGNTEPVHRTGTVAGNLPAPMALCRWCYDFVGRTGDLPTVRQVKAHDDGIRVMVQA